MIPPAMREELSRQQYRQPRYPRERRATPAAMFWRYWTASTISSAGDAVTAVALPLTAVKLLDATSFQVSLLTATTYAAWVMIGLPAGVIASRLPLRGTQVSMDLIRAAALLSIPVAAGAGELSFAQLVVVTLIVGLASVVFDVSNSTFLPSIVSKQELTARNSLTSGSVAVTQLGGPSLGGLLVQVFGAATALLTDAASYLVSAVLLHGLPRPASAAATRRPAPPHLPASPHAQTQGPGLTRTSVPAQIAGGWRYVMGHPVVRPCVLAATLTNFTCGALMALTPVFLVRTLGTPAGLVGVLIAAEGLGSLAGAAITPRLTALLGSARTVLAALFAGATLALLIPSATSGWGLVRFAVGNAGFAVGVVVLSISARTHRQTVTPSDLLPRVMATVRFISWGAIPFGALAAGLTATAVGNRGAMWASCACAFLAPLALLATPVRSLRNLASPGRITHADRVHRAARATAR
jgi:MFS family permease